MSQSSRPDTPGGFAKLPIDVLLNIFDGCDVADILNVALTCKKLHTATEERHVWLIQFKRRCMAFRQAPFRSRTRELHVHSTAQLKSWTIQQARTDTLWLQNWDRDDNLKLQSVHTNDLAGYAAAFLLPGGEHLVVFTASGEMALKNIKLGTVIGGSEWVLAHVAHFFPQSPDGGHTCKVFTDTSCEYPLITSHNCEDASVTIFCLDHDSQTISVQREIRANPNHTPVGYEMDFFGIRGDTIMWFYADRDGGFQRHLIVAKLNDPDDAATRHLNLDRSLGTPRVSSFEVLTANAFIQYDSGGIYLYHIPHMPSGIQSRDQNDKRQTPLLIWSSYDGSASGEYGGLYYDRTDAVLPKFYLHNEKYSHMIEFGIDTPTDAEHDPCIGYPAVLNHTVTPADGDPNDRLSFRWAKGRRGVHFGFNSSGGEFHTSTVLIDDPDRRGYFRGSLGRYRLLDNWWIERMEHDEVTGRVFLVIGDGDSGACELFFADLPA